MSTTDRERDGDLVDRLCAELRSTEGSLHDHLGAAVRRATPLASDDTRSMIADLVTARLTGLGELDPLVADPTIDEVLVNDADIWVDRAGSLERVGRLSTVTTDDVIERVLAPLGRRVDRSSPIVDARLPSGARVCAVVPPVAVDGPCLSIRRFGAAVRPLADFLPDASEPARRGRLEHLCQLIVDRRCNVLVSGATSSGKTSLLASLLALADPGERIVVLEDTAELPCDAPHLVRLEARPPTVDGPVAVPLDELVRTALRLRPDRLVVGEVRGAEVVALVKALNTGHDGSFATCHANGPLYALLRLESLVLQAAPRWPLEAIRQQLRRSIDVIVHVGRGGSRRAIRSIHELADEPAADGTPSLRELIHASDLSRTREAA